MAITSLPYTHPPLIRCFSVFLFKDAKSRGMRISKKRKTEKVKKEINGDEETKAVSEVILHSIAHVTSLKIAFEVAFECTHTSDMKVGISLYLVTPCNNVCCSHCSVLSLPKLFRCLSIPKVFR